MGQLGFFDLDERYRGLDAKKDPLVVLNEVVPWEDFRARLSAVWRKPEEERKNAAGRKPWDEIVIFKALVLQALYNLSDDQIEYQIRDRLSFMRVLGLGLEDRVPDATTVWLYREKLAQAGLVEALFDAFDAHLKSRGYLAMGGQIVDASIVSAPVQRNSREENQAIKDGHPPVAWKPNKKAQKDAARAPLPRPVQLHRPEPHLDPVALGVIGQRPFGGKQSQLPRAPAVLVEALDHPTPIGVLAVVDLAQVQNRLLHHPAPGTASALDNAPVAVLLAVLDSSCGAQVHAGEFYADLQLRKEAWSSLQAISSRLPLKRLAFLSPKALKNPLYQPQLRRLG